MQTFCFIDSDGRVACAETQENPMHQNPDATLQAASRAASDRTLQAAASPRTTLQAAPLNGGGAPSPAPPTAPAGPTFDEMLARARPLPEGCCVHVLTDSLDSISMTTPADGKVDCPAVAELDGVDVKVLGVGGDGNGGMLAVFGTVPGPDEPVGVTAAPRQIFAAPICSAGTQEEEPVRCCIGNDRTLMCFDEDGNPDPSNPLNGLDAEDAVARGLTLQLCEQPPAEIEGCCFELMGPPDQNGRAMARVVCDDPERAEGLDGAEIEVRVSQDGTTASYQLTDSYSLELPICVTTEIPEEVPCCVEDGILVCRDPDGNVVSELDGKTVEEAAAMGLTVEPCPQETTPQEPPPPDCCVKALPDGGMILVCKPVMTPNGPMESPWNGYELLPAEFTVAEDGSAVKVLLTGPDGNRMQFVFPMCPTEKTPPDLCYDAATGKVKSSSADFDGREPSLVDIVSQGPDGPMFALIELEGLGDGRGPVRVPLCPEEPVPLECCFKPNNDGTPNGTLVCKDDMGQSTSEFDGVPAILMDANQMPDGTPIVTVSFEGGTARMPICEAPKEDCFFCCVNLDTGTLVCPGVPEMDGQAAAIVEVFEYQGRPFARLRGGRVVPTCGVQCPPPRVCPECPEPGECPEPPPCPECPPAPECPPGEVVEKVVEKVVYRDRPCQATPQSGFPCTPSTIGANGLPQVMGGGAPGGGIRTSATPYQQWKANYERPGIGLAADDCGPMNTGSRR